MRFGRYLADIVSVISVLTDNVSATFGFHRYRYTDIIVKLWGRRYRYRRIGYSPKIQRKRLKDKGHKNYKPYSGHSPRYRAAQYVHAANNGIPFYDIWASKSASPLHLHVVKPDLRWSQARDAMANMPNISTIINSVFPRLYLNSKTKHGISTSIRLARKLKPMTKARRTIARMHKSLSTSRPVGIQIGHLGHGYIFPFDYDTNSKGHSIRPADRSRGYMQ